MQLACIYSNVDGSMNKLDAISMPDNDSNCPIKTRNDVTTPRNAITSASMLSRTYTAIKRPSPTFIAYMSTDFWELLNQYNSFKERGVCDWIENVALVRSQSCKGTHSLAEQDSSSRKGWIVHWFKALYVWKVNFNLVLCCAHYVLSSKQVCFFFKWQNIEYLYTILF